MSMRRRLPAFALAAIASSSAAAQAADTQAPPPNYAAAFLGTGQIPTEELAFLGSLAKFGMGMVDGDGNTRQCMATAARAYKESFGFDAPPYSYADFEQSDVIVLVGSNLCIAHPILWERICRNPYAPEIVVVDPRATETAAAATRHLAIRPKSDLVLFYGLAARLLERGAVENGGAQGEEIPEAREEVAVDLFRQAFDQLRPRERADRESLVAGLAHREVEAKEVDGGLYAVPEQHRRLRVRAELPRELLGLRAEVA